MPTLNAKHLRYLSGECSLAHTMFHDKLSHMLQFLTGNWPLRASVSIYLFTEKNLSKVSIKSRYSHVTHIAG